MKAFRYSIFISLLWLLPNLSFSQKSNIWLTYGQSKFIYSPGIESNYYINRYVGFQIGVGTYIQSYNRDQIVNITDDYKFNFYNANLGLCAMLVNKKKHKIGVTIGFKIYYGPEFVVLHYYKIGGYNLYFDSSGLRPRYGVDFGIFYSFKKISGIVKFDTARKKIRFGLGYVFGKTDNEKEMSQNSLK